MEEVDPRHVREEYEPSLAKYVDYSSLQLLLPGTHRPPAPPRAYHFIARQVLQPTTVLHPFCQHSRHGPVVGYGATVALRESILEHRTPVEFQGSRVAHLSQISAM